MAYYTDCGGQFPSLQKRNYCNNVTLGKQIDFYVDVTLKKYPDNQVYVRQTILSGKQQFNSRIIFWIYVCTVHLPLHSLSLLDTQNPGGGNLLERVHGFGC